LEPNLEVSGTGATGLEPATSGVTDHFSILELERSRPAWLHEAVLVDFEHRDVRQQARWGARSVATVST
jgi:hypothetical protein